MQLIIVESPTKARTLSRFLGNDYQIQATMGHVRDLPQKKFGVDIKNDFTPEYEVVSGRQKNISEIKKSARSAQQIYLATDPDREGEAIAWHVAQLIAANSNLLRIVFHEITKSALENALSHPRDIDQNLVEAQVARRVLDRIVGYKLSPLLWRKVKSGLSAGRVQSVAVRLIVEREREIEAFKPEEYWEIFCQLKSQISNVKTSEFIVQLIKIGDEKADIKNKEQADRIVSDLEKAGYSVDSIDKKEVIKSPPAPFTTSTMTQAASRLFFWSAKKTMSFAQKLYEEGLITYHRTDSTNLAAEAVNKARLYIEKEFGKSYLPEKPRFYKTKSKVAQEAHEAIRPTDINLKSQMSNVKTLGKDSEKLYELIWKRFVACQMSEAVYDETVINVLANLAVNDSSFYLLQARGQVMKFDGWKKLYPAKAQNLNDGDSQQLPLLEKDELLDLVHVDPQQKFTQPPVRYTEATLIKTLEKLGIGRPSTYAPIISTIQDRNYVEKTDGKFLSTPIGIATSDFLTANFSDIVDYQFTARMEDDLDEVANGKADWIKMLKDFWPNFANKLETVSQEVKRVKIELEETGEMCPECKVGKQVIRLGRFGKFLSCSRFPECKWKAKYVEKIGIKCPDCKEGDVVIKKTPRGRKFFGCSRYPNCKWASWNKPQEVEKGFDTIDKK